MFVLSVREIHNLQAATLCADQTHQTVEFELQLALRAGLMQLCSLLFLYK
jgi:hypothetical protein